MIKIIWIHFTANLFNANIKFIANKFACQQITLHACLCVCVRTL